MPPHNECVYMGAEQMLMTLGGFYQCPRETADDGTITWLGPLVGCRSKGSDGNNMVGPEYANFDVIGADAHALEMVARRMQGLVMRHFFEGNKSFTEGSRRVTFCGIPTGGATITDRIKEFGGHRFITISKKTVGDETETMRAGEELYFSAGNEPVQGEHVVLVEDVCNGFSATSAAVRLTESYGAEVVLIAMFLNRSMTVGREFLYGDRRIPVRAQWRRSMQIYEQSDPCVANAKIILRPKEHWDELMEVMKAHA